MAQADYTSVTLTRNLFQIFENNGLFQSRLEWFWRINTQYARINTHISNTHVSVPSVPRVRSRQMETQVGIRKTRNPKARQRAAPLGRRRRRRLAVLVPTCFSICLDLIRGTDTCVLDTCLLIHAYWVLIRVYCVLIRAH